MMLFTDPSFCLFFLFITSCQGFHLNNIFLLLLLFVMEPEKKKNHVFYWGFLWREDQQPVPKLLPELTKHHIVSVKAGGFYFLALTAEGQVWGWGVPKHCRFGIISNDDVKVPTHLPLKIKVIKIAAGNWHSLLIDNEYQIYGCGHNKYGAVGISGFHNINQYTKVPADGPVVDVWAGDGYSLALTSNGRILTCGHSAYHGHKSTQHLGEMKALSLEEEFQTMSAGFTHALAVTKKGKVYSWGEGTFHQLGHGEKKDVKCPKLVEKLLGVHIVQVSCTRGEKHAHSMAVDADGGVWSWGAGYKGKLGHHEEWSHADQADEPYPKLVKSIEGVVEKPVAGGIHSGVLTKDGSILTFGCGSDGRLGHIQSTDHRYLYREGIPRKIDTLSNYYITDFASSYYHNICVGYPTEQKQKK